MTNSQPLRLAGPLFSLLCSAWLAACGAAPRQVAPVSPGGYAAFEHHGVQPVVDATEERTATVGLSRDRASYTIARHYLEAGRWPPAASVRVEDFVAALGGAPRVQSPPSWLSASIGPSPFRAGWHVLVLRVSARHLGWAADPRRPQIISDRAGALEEAFLKRGLAVRRDGLGAKVDLGHEGPLVILSSGAGLGGPEAQGTLLARAAAQRVRAPVSVIGRIEGGLDDALLDAVAGAGGGAYELVRPDELEATLDRLLAPALAMEARLVVDFEGIERWRLIGYESTSPAPWSGEVVGTSLTDETVNVLFELDLAKPSAEVLGAVTLEARPVGSGRSRKVGPMPLRPAARDDEHDRVALIATTAEVLRGSYWSKDVALEVLWAEAQRLDNADLSELIALVLETASTGARKVRPSRRESPLP